MINNPLLNYKMLIVVLLQQSMSILDNTRNWIIFPCVSYDIFYLQVSRLKDLDLRMYERYDA